LSFRWMTRHSSRGMPRAARVFRWRNRSAVASSRNDRITSRLHTTRVLCNRSTSTRAVPRALAHGPAKCHPTCHAVRHRGVCRSLHAVGRSWKTHRDFDERDVTENYRHEPSEPPARDIEAGEAPARVAICPASTCPQECRRRLAACHDLGTGQVLRREIHVTRNISGKRGLVGVGCGRSTALNRKSRLRPDAGNLPEVLNRYRLPRSGLVQARLC
jgi:hypothetical protein